MKDTLKETGKGIDTTVLQKLRFHLQVGGLGLVLQLGQHLHILLDGLRILRRHLNQLRVLPLLHPTLHSAFRPYASRFTSRGRSSVGVSTGMLIPTFFSISRISTISSYQMQHPPSDVSFVL